MYIEKSDSNIPKVRPQKYQGVSLNVQRTNEESIIFFPAWLLYPQPTQLLNLRAQSSDSKGRKEGRKEER